MDAITPRSQLDTENATSNCTVTLEGLATAVPPNIMPQEILKSLAKEMLGDRYEDFARLSSIMQNAGIKNRYLAQPASWYAGNHDFGSIIPPDSLLLS